MDQLYKNFVRYHNKVESLKEAADKKKTLKDSDLEKISRNESKLRTARKEYRRNVVDCTLLTEEVTERGWKDLLPFIIRMINFHVDSSTATADCMARLVVVRQDLECLAERFDMGQDTIRYGRIETLLEEDAMAFVSPQHIQDIESSQPSVASYIPPAERLRNPRGKTQSESEDDVYEDSPSGSDNDSVGPMNEMIGTVARVHPEPVNVNKKPTATPEHEIEMEEQGSITSIYFNGAILPMDDDETTLTPFPGTFGKPVLVSVGTSL